MLVDSEGKPLRRTEAAQAVVLTSIDKENWAPLHYALIPDWVKSHDVMGDMMRGAVVAEKDNDVYYCVERLH